MKSTGIVRYIDDLGRIVIPKELRRAVDIIAGDALEIWVNPDGEIRMKKYTPELFSLAHEVTSLKCHIGERENYDSDKSRWIRKLEEVRKEMFLAEHARHAMQNNEESAVTEV